MVYVRTAIISILLIWCLLNVNCVSTATRTASYQEVPPISIKPEPDQDLTEGVKTRISGQDENTFIYRGLAILEAFETEYQALKKDGVIGENNQGLLSNMLQQSGVDFPLNTRDKYKSNSDYSEILMETIQQVNMAREFLMEGYILNQKRINPDFNPDKKELLKLQGKNYQSFLQRGDYLQNEKGTWIRKK